LVKEEIAEFSKNLDIEELYGYIFSVKISSLTLEKEKPLINLVKSKFIKGF